MKVTRRQFLKISTGAIGTVAAAELVHFGLDTSVVQARALSVPIKTGKQVPSICAYCAVGCATIVSVDDAGKIIDIQGNPDSPINQGTLCPKGAGSFQLHVNPLRWTKVKHRAPDSDHWEDMTLDAAMERIAQLTKATHDANFNVTQDVPDGKGGTVTKRVMNTYAVASLGGSTMDNE
jgi:formate dehydrogenase major subunit